VSSYIWIVLLAIPVCHCHAVPECQPANVSALAGSVNRAVIKPRPYTDDDKLLTTCRVQAAAADVQLASG